jgi:PAS domain S-box-containing protein
MFASAHRRRQVSLKAGGHRKEEHKTDGVKPITPLPNRAHAHPEREAAFIPHAAEHVVQFYETDTFLVDAVSGFIGAGLGAGEAGIVIATRAHREAIEQRLQANGLDLAAARARGAYISQDAGETLGQFMLDSLPEPKHFTELIGHLLAQAARGQRQVRVFGEMVMLLWTQGNQAAAIRLERLWNDLLQQTSPFSLYCAYPMNDFAGAQYAGSLATICQQHSHVIPAESYTALDDSEKRLLAITRLQQQAHSLQAEIAERKAAEERLRISENRYRRLFEASPDGIVMLDPDTGAIIDANPALTALLGVSRERLLGQELWQIGLFEDRERQRVFLQQVQEQQLLRYEALPIPTKDGQPRSIELVSTLYQANGHKVIQCHLRDITEHKELETQREAFISMVTHELKTPLTSIQGNIQLAQRRLTHLLSQVEQLPPEQQRALEAVQNALSRSQQSLRVQHRLINDLLDVSRLQEDKLELHLAPCDLVEIVYETVQDYQAAHPSRLITLELPEQAPLQVMGDRDRLQQVLSNYVANALKFSPTSEPVHIGLSLEGENARVWVQDHGPGLAPKEQQRVWKRFYQAPQTPIQNESKAGLGLGLYVCQQLINRQRGQVGIESTPGNGATFWYTLPLISAARG